MTGTPLLPQLEPLHADAYGWALHCCRGDSHAAEEVLQMAYCCVAEEKAVFGGRAELKTWWLGVIRLVALEQRRRAFWRLEKLRAWFVAGGRLGEVEHLGTLKIGQDLRGGLGRESGAIEGASLTSLSLGGSVFGGRGNLSGYIGINESLGSVTIAGDLRGADNLGATVADTGSVQAKHLGAITIGGSLVGGVVSGGGRLLRSGSVTASDDIGSFVVKGSIVGNATQKVFISARGQATPAGATDTAIKSLTVGGRVEFTNLLVGYSRSGLGQNADAQIGAVTGGGDWIASFLLVGVNPSDFSVGDANDIKLNGNFGAGQVKDNANVISKIARIVIGGGSSAQ